MQGCEGLDRVTKSAAKARREEKIAKCYRKERSEGEAKEAERARRKRPTVSGKITALWIGVQDKGKVPVITMGSQRAPVTASGMGWRGVNRTDRARVLHRTE